MKQVVIITGLCFVTFFKVYSQNLVPNYSFELFDVCPYTNGNFHLVNWYRVLASPDYYNSCHIPTPGNINVDVPNNWLGEQIAHSGEAYVGIVVWSKTVLNGREFFSGKLNEPLIPGKKYNVEFYLSLTDSMWYGSKNMGAYFSTDSIEEQVTSDFFFSKTPQIKYSGIDYLSDKDDWMKVSESFFADGGEQFITIGNFDTDDNIDTLFVGTTTGGALDKKQSYYYIDDVSVKLDTMTGINELGQIKFEIYPNPATDKLTIQTEINKSTSLQLLDITGRVVFIISLSAATTSMDIAMLPAGVYTAVLLQNGAVATRRKIVIQ